jgi:Eukaryotic initiation factor 4E
MSTQMSFNPDDKIPTGEWTLYFHSPREKKWSIETYTEIGTVATWREMFALLNALGDTKLKGGMYFWMRKGIPPLWENYQNIRGGSYSLRGGIDNGVDIFVTYSVGAMMGIATNKDDKVMGINISPKLVGGGNRDTDQTIGFYTIKIWNQDCMKFGKSSGLTLLDKHMATEDVLYTPHNEKKM